ncbi:FliH/SctL family protein [Erythrobacter sp. MTPC3]|uniref:FliH/SctL family protein n=1 Tax=Erythrobacter sp. MTPC3 TaxID=3056564 RepID=UPI0036F3E0C7
MANLSDLSAETAPPPIPDWIGNLEASQGFIPHSGLPHFPSTQQTVPNPAETQADAIADAFSRGEAAGRVAANEEQQQQNRDRQVLSLAFTQLDEAAQDVLRQQLAEMVVRLCTQVIEPHLIERAALEQRCAEAVAMLAEAPAKCRLHLNPDDIDLLDETFAAQWAIEPDADLKRGALRLEGPDGLVRDGPDTWRSAIIQALRP